MASTWQLVIRSAPRSRSPPDAFPRNEDAAVLKVPADLTMGVVKLKRGHVGAGVQALGASLAPLPESAKELSGKRATRSNMT